MELIKSVKNPMIITPWPKEADGVRSLDEYYFFKQKLIQSPWPILPNRRLIIYVVLIGTPVILIKKYQKSEFISKLIWYLGKSFGEGKEELFSSLSTFDGSTGK